MNKPIKNFLIIIVIAGLLILLAVPKLKGLWTKDEKKADTARQAENTAMQVTGIIIKPDTLNKELTVAGNVLADEQIEVRSEVSGLITSINFKEGQRVHKGQLLVKINDAELQAQLKKLLSEQKVVRERLKRQDQLLKKEAISKEEYEEAVNEVTAAQANIDLVRAQIAKTAITAPFDGTIGLKEVSDGSYITPAQKIASLININPVKIDFSVPERYANVVRVGSKVNFMPAAGREMLTAEVYAVEPSVDVSTRTIRIRAHYPNPDNQVYPGNFVEMHIPLESKFNSYSIPTEALVPEATSASVYVYNSGKAVPRPVETGMRTDDGVEITGGLKAGDTVIVSGIIQLRPQMDVQLTLRNQ